MSRQEILSKMFLELGQLLPKTVITERETDLIIILVKCLKYIEENEVPESTISFDIDRAMLIGDVKKILREYRTAGI